MAKSTVPGAIERRHLIEKEIGEAQALKIAESYLDEDRIEESLIFLEKAGANDRLAELRANAVTAGDAFLLRSIAASMGETPSRSEWSAVEAAAAAAGRDLYVATAHRQLEVDVDE
jgi:hypothetical protein